MSAQAERRIVKRVHAVSVGDVIAYPGTLGYGKERGERDWLTVTRIDKYGLHGTRVNPEGEWDRDVEFVVVTRQVEDNGVEVAH